MEAKLFQDVLGGLVQENTPVRMRYETGTAGKADIVAFDIKRFEIGPDGVAYLVIDHERSHIIPESSR